MTRKEKAKKQAKEYKIKKSAMLKQQAGEDLSNNHSDCCGLNQERKILTRGKVKIVKIKEQS